ncbi:hypothetical protein [Actinoallomurus sp. CA-150999]|uniref:hypothetical protein n=1 Tax=Actinoallomurus sp. CA-150999 TaxID=3239887 RepID=UPI003D8B09B4
MLNAELHHPQPYRKAGQVVHGAARQVATRLGISRASAYDYLAEARAASSPDGTAPPQKAEG